MRKNLSETRRRFLAQLGAGAVLGALSRAGARADTTPSAPRRLRIDDQYSLLGPDDFVYLGSFRLPEEVTYGGMGLEYYDEGNNGAGSLFVGLQRNTDYPNTFCEVAIPSPVISPERRAADLPTAALVRGAFDHTGGVASAYLRVDPPNRKIVTVALGIINVPKQGKKLFSAFAGWYTGPGTYNLVYCDLNPDPTKPVVTNPRGPWAFEGVSSSQYASSIWSVPESWASAYLGGRAIGVGGLVPGHVVSETGGGHSAFYWAPWVDDTARSAPPPNTNLSYLTAARFMGSESPNLEGTLMRYPARVVDWGWKPAPDAAHPGGYNYFWNGEAHTGMRWITGSTGKAALVGASSIGGGWSCYIDGDSAVQQDHAAYGSWPWPRQGPNGSRHYFTGNPVPAKGPVTKFHRPALLLFDPADHAAVAAGEKKPHDVVAYDVKNLWSDLSLDGKYDWYRDTDGTIKCYDGVYRDTRDHFNHTGGWQLTGAAYDAVRRRYYLLQYGAHAHPMGPLYPLVHVYQVA